jgi:threonine aldolase
MRRAIAEAEVGDDVLGDDPTVERLQAMVAGMLGKEASLYCSSGTQTNQLAVNTQTTPGDEVILEETAHISMNEVGAPGSLSGVILRPIKGVAGVIPFDAVEEMYSEGSLHRRRTALICVENTHNRAGGSIYPIEEMERLSLFARERGVRVHLDGARLFNASAETGIPVSRYAALADTVSVCLSKGLGAPIGSCLAGSREDIERARMVRKSWGGGMRQVGIIAAAGIYALEHNMVRLKEDHENARLLARGLSEIPGLSLDSAGVATNIVIFEVTKPGMDARRFTEVLRERGVLMLPAGRSQVRAVTHLHIERQHIERALEVIARIFCRPEKACGA